MKAYHDIFISYSRKDSTFAVKLVNALSEKGLNVWFDKKDIPHAVDFQNQIDEAITYSHNILFVISPDSVKSEYCQKEAKLADLQGKRILPVLYISPENEDLEQISEKVRRHNWIYSGIDDSEFEESIKNIENVINSQSALVHQHTILLSKALRFNKQKKEEDILSVNEVETAKEWINQLQGMNVLPCYPTVEQIDFIVESEFWHVVRKNKEIKQSQKIFDVYLCFSAKNKSKKEVEFIKRLYSALVEYGFSVETNEFDRTGGANTKLRVTNGIVKARNFVYIITESTVQDEFCEFELGVAEEYSKKMIPIVYKDKELKSNLLPKSIQRYNWIFMREDDSFESGVGYLAGAMFNDQEYVNAHTFVSYQAFLWSINGEDPRFLLKDDELEGPKTWLQVSNFGDFSRNQLSEIQIRFIEKSIESSSQKNWFKRIFKR